MQLLTNQMKQLNFDHFKMGGNVSLTSDQVREKTRDEMQKVCQQIVAGKVPFYVKQFNFTVNTHSYDLFNHYTTQELETNLKDLDEALFSTEARKKYLEPLVMARNSSSPYNEFHFAYASYEINGKRLIIGCGYASSAMFAAVKSVFVGIYPI